MAHNVTQFTVVPSIPQDLLCGLEGHILMQILGNEEDEGNTRYIFCEEAAGDTIDIDDDLIALVENGSGPIAEALEKLDLENQRADILVLSEVGIDYVDLLLELCRKHPDKLQRIEIEGCWSCSKMRPGEFGGFAYSITPSGSVSMSTAHWLGTIKTGKLPLSAA